jgi:DNA-binding MarR family transcriptional regulator
VAEDTASGWSFLTNHARVLVCIAHDPGIRTREIGERLGITERAAHRIVGALTAAGTSRASETVAAPVHDQRPPLVSAVA